MRKMLGEFKVLKTVVLRLNKAGIPYMITGSVAMNYYAQPRMTRDVDIVVEIGSRDIEKFYGLFRNDFYIDLGELKTAVKTRGMFNIIHLKEIFKIDFIVRKQNSFRALEFQRRRKVKIDDFEVFLINPEDLILSKLLWAKKSHSEFQLKDVKNLLQTQVDLGYIRKWANKLTVVKLLEEALDGRHN